MERIKIQTTQPEAWKALYDLSGIVSKSDLTPVQAHLIKVRVSQINSCAYCLDMHTREALKIGETPQRLFVLSAWKETALFTLEEKALLALTEAVTLIHRNGVPENVYAEAARYFSSRTMGDIILAAVVMNSWNRIAVSTQLQVPA